MTAAADQNATSENFDARMDATRSVITSAVAIEDHVAARVRRKLAAQLAELLVDDLAHRFAGQDAPKRNLNSIRHGFSPWSMATMATRARPLCSYTSPAMHRRHDRQQT
jgi:hypothetical protein